MQITYLQDAGKGQVFSVFSLVVGVVFRVVLFTIYPGFARFMISMVNQQETCKAENLKRKGCTIFACFPALIYCINTAAEVGRLEALDDLEPKILDYVAACHLAKSLRMGMIQKLISHRNVTETPMIASTAFRGHVDA